MATLLAALVLEGKSGLPLRASRRSASLSRDASGVLCVCKANFCLSLLPPPKTRQRAIMMHERHGLATAAAANALGRVCFGDGARTLVFCAGAAPLARSRDAERTHDRVAVRIGDQATHSMGPPPPPVAVLSAVRRRALWPAPTTAKA